MNSRHGRGRHPRLPLLSHDTPPPPRHNTAPYQAASTLYTTLHPPLCLHPTLHPEPSMYCTPPYSTLFPPPYKYLTLTSISHVPPLLHPKTSTQHPPLRHHHQNHSRCIYSTLGLPPLHPPPPDALHVPLFHLPVTTSRHTPPLFHPGPSTPPHTYLTGF